MPERNPGLDLTGIQVKRIFAIEAGDLLDSVKKCGCAGNRRDGTIDRIEEMTRAAEKQQRLKNNSD